MNYECCTNQIYIRWKEIEGVISAIYFEFQRCKQFYISIDPGRCRHRKKLLGGGGGGVAWHCVHPPIYQ